MYLAQRPPTEGTEVICDTTGRNCVATIKGFEWIFNNTITVILGLAGIILFIMLLIGGFTLLTSGDNVEKAAAARKTITYAVGGIVVAALAYLILVLIYQFTGANVTVFRIR